MKAMFEMKTETKARFIFIVLTVCLAAHFFYYAFIWEDYLPVGLLFIGVWSLLLLYHVSLKPRKIRIPDYSNIFNYIGFLIAAFSLVFYFSYFAGLWENDDLIYLDVLIVIGYSCFLTWYKYRFWG